MSTGTIAVYSTSVSTINPVDPAQTAGSSSVRWSDGSDATYTRTFTSWNGGTNSAYAAGANGSLEALGMPYGSTVSDITVNFRASGTGGSPMRVDAQIQDSGGTTKLYMYGDSSGNAITITSGAANYTHSVSAYDLTATGGGATLDTLGALLAGGGASLFFKRYSNPGDTSYHYGITVYEASVTVTYTTAPYTIAPFSEAFEGGTGGAVVTTANTGFWKVGTSITFTADSYRGALAATSATGYDPLTVYPDNRISGVFNSPVVTEGKLKIASGGAANNTIYLLSTSIVDSTDMTNGCFNCGPSLFLSTDGSLGGGNNISLQWSSGTSRPYVPPGNHDTFTLAYDTWYHVVLTWYDATSTFSLVVTTGDDATTVYSRLNEPGSIGSLYYDSQFFFAWNGSTTTWDEIAVNSPFPPLNSGGVDLLLMEADLTRHEVTGWPIGSIWFDPDAETGGLVTASVGDQDESTVHALPATSDWERAPGFEKVTVSCPPGTGGLLMVTALGTFTVHGSPVVEMRLASDADDSLFPLVRLPLTQSFVLTGNLRLEPGDAGEVWVEYRYLSGSGATVEATALVPSFYPAGVRPGVVADPWGRYWDGDSWRPTVLQGADMEFEDGVEPPPVKDPSTTHVTRTPAQINPNQIITLTATVTPLAANGNVMFFKGPTATGPWTKLGAVALDSTNKARRTLRPSSPQEMFFRARYQGSGFYSPSADVSGSTLVLGPKHQVHVRFGADWVESYDWTGASIDNVVRQGFFDETDGKMKSLIGFTADLPSDAQVASVRLVCKNWVRWANGANGGTLRVGWHSRTTEPVTFGVGSGEADKSAHSVNHEGAFDVALPLWACNALERNDFAGISLGAGDTSRAAEYNGHAEGGRDPWILDVTYTTRT